MSDKYCIPLLYSYYENFLLSREGQGMFLLPLQIVKANIRKYFFFLFFLVFLIFPKAKGSITDTCGCLFVCLFLILYFILEISF